MELVMFVLSCRHKESTFCEKYGDRWYVGACWRDICIVLQSCSTL